MAAILLNILDLIKAKGKETQYVLTYLFYNSSHNILTIFDVLPNFAFRTSEMKRDY